MYTLCHFLDNSHSPDVQSHTLSLIDYLITVDYSLNRDFIKVGIEPFLISQIQKASPNSIEYLLSILKAIACDSINNAQMLVLSGISQPLYDFLNALPPKTKLEIRIDAAFLSLSLCCVEQSPDFCLAAFHHLSRLLQDDRALRNMRGMVHRGGIMLASSQSNSMQIPSQEHSTSSSTLGMIKEDDLVDLLWKLNDVFRYREQGAIATLLNIYPLFFKDFLDLYKFVSIGYFLFLFPFLFQ